MNVLESLSPSREIFPKGLLKMRHLLRCIIVKSRSMTTSKPRPPIEPTHNTADNLDTDVNENGNGGNLLNVEHWKEKNASLSESCIKADRHSNQDNIRTEEHIIHLQDITTEHFEKKKIKKESPSPESKVEIASSHVRAAKEHIREPTNQ